MCTRRGRRTERGFTVVCSTGANHARCRGRTSVPGANGPERCGDLEALRRGGHRRRSERPAFELHYPHMIERMRAESHVGWGSANRTSHPVTVATVHAEHDGRAPGTVQQSDTGSESDGES
ncbi:hypothetical protein C8259_08325 [Nocardia nova]|uniref:Uncharacterized protein n=1 Tax=Nocardia nova TaxID=37330 RepID=A0A2T2ZB15_9NOCA|nr:hypothetical protein C8259_08325 [Nocardia nova]